MENREVLNFEAEDYANKNNLEEIQDSKPIKITEEEKLEKKKDATSRSPKLQQVLILLINIF